MAIGIFDYLAVIVFILTAITLIRFLKSRVKLSILITSIVALTIITFAGTIKATNKLIIGINGNDIIWMKQYFFVFQAVGFSILLFVIYYYLRKNFKKDNTIKNLSIIPLPFLLFLSIEPSKIYKPICQVLLFTSITLILVCYSYMSYKIKYKKYLYLYIGTEVFMILMTVIGFLPQLNEWVKESFNTANQVFFLLSTYFFCKNQNEYELKKQNIK